MTPETGTYRGVTVEDLALEVSVCIGKIDTLRLLVAKTGRWIGLTAADAGQVGNRSADSLRERLNRALPVYETAGHQLTGRVADLSNNRNSQRTSWDLLDTQGSRKAREYTGQGDVNREPGRELTAAADDTAALALLTGDDCARTTAGRKTAARLAKASILDRIVEEGA